MRIKKRRACKPCKPCGGYDRRKCRKPMNNRGRKYGRCAGRGARVMSEEIVENQALDQYGNVGVETNGYGNGNGYDNVVEADSYGELGIEGNNYGEIDNTEVGSEFELPYEYNPILKEEQELRRDFTPGGNRFGSMFMERDNNVRQCAFYKHDPKPDHYKPFYRQQRRLCD